MAPRRDYVRRIGEYLGLVTPEAGMPLPGAPRVSRYRGSPRLDQDVDALRARVDDLESRIARLEQDSG